MNIVHLCLCGPVTDNWNYQDNLLTKYHKKLGYSVTIITSQWVWDKNGGLVVNEETEYINDDGVKVIRLILKGRNDFNKKIKRYLGIYEALVQSSPDLIFIHGCQFVEMNKVVKYIKSNPNVKIYVDNHADFSNSARTWLSKNILHKILWKRSAKMIEPYTTKFYGVLPARVDFLTDIYGIEKNKVDLLVMGADDEKVYKSKSDVVKKEVRKRHNIAEDDFLIITGGKIDSAKIQTILLMKAVREIDDKKVKLIVFGSVDNEIKRDVEKLVDGEKIQYIGWLDAEDTYNYFSASDLVVFPGRHSVFWEQVVGQGVPMIVKYWEGTDHVNIGGNVEFLYNDSVEEIKKSIIEILINPQKYHDMKSVALDKGMKIFSYKDIAKRSIM